MYSTDREQFDVQLSLLCQGYGFWVGERSEAYWKGLSKMSMIEFARCVEHALSETGPEKIPNVHGIWKIRNELRAKTPALNPPPKPAPPDQSKWLRLVNGLFLKYIMQRRLNEKFKGDISILPRRAECLKLVKIFEEEAAGVDPSLATVENLTVHFHAAMKQVVDGS